jgi:hypothetical protein
MVSFLFRPGKDDPFEMAALFPDEFEVDARPVLGNQDLGIGMLEAGDYLVGSQGKIKGYRHASRAPNTQVRVNILGTARQTNRDLVILADLEIRISGKEMREPKHARLELIKGRLLSPENDCRLIAA